MALIRGGALSIAIVVVLSFGVLRSRLPAARLIWSFAFALLLSSGVASMVAHSYLARWGFHGDSPRDGLVAMMTGTAARPFVYRRLVPEAVRLVTAEALARLPARTVEYLRDKSRLQRYGGDWNGPELWDSEKAVAFHVAFVLLWLTFVGATLALAGLLRVECGYSWIRAVSVSSIGMAFLPLTFARGAYLYDGAELFLWTLTLATVARGRLALLPVWYALLLLNKESALLAVPALFPFLHVRVGAKRAIASIAALAGMALGWNFYVHRHYNANLGGVTERWLLENLGYWLEPHTYFSVEQDYAPVLPSPGGGNALFLLLLFVPLRFGWPRARKPMRRSAQLAALVLLPTFLAFGYHDEFRALLLLVPYLLVIGSEGVCVLDAHPIEQVR